MSAKSIKDVKTATELKLADLNRQRSDEFQRMHCLFVELHKELDERELLLKQQINEEVKEAEMKLMQDLQRVQEEYRGQMKTFKAFKRLSDQFGKLIQIILALSSEAGIVGAADKAFGMKERLEQETFLDGVKWFIHTEEGQKEITVPQFFLNLGKT